MEFSSSAEVNKWIMEQYPDGVMWQDVDRLLGQFHSDMVMKCRTSLVRDMQTFPDEKWHLIGLKWYPDRVVTELNQLDITWERARLLEMLREDIMSKSWICMGLID